MYLAWEFGKKDQRFWFKVCSPVPHKNHENETENGCRITSKLSTVHTPTAFAYTSFADCLEPSLLCIRDWHFLIEMTKI